MDGSVVAVAETAVAPGVAAASIAVMATAVAAAAPASSMHTAQHTRICTWVSTCKAAARRVYTVAQAARVGPQVHPGVPATGRCRILVD